jgi:hypothetical protein
MLNMPAVAPESILSLACAFLTAARAYYEASGSLSLQSLRARRFGYRYSHLSHPEGYSDKDGDADSDTLARYSDRLPKTLAAVFVTVDFIFVTVRMVATTLPSLSLLEVVARVSNLHHIRFGQQVYAVLTCMLAANSR